MPTPEQTQWFLEQVRLEQSRLRAFVRSLGVRPEAVDDFAQDALVVAYEKIDAFDRSYSFGPWVCGIARRLVANALRKEQRHQRIISEHLTEFLVETPVEEWHPLFRTDEQDRIAALTTCMEELPSYSRQLLNMKYFENLSAGVIGSRTERSANDVRQMLLRIRRALMACMEGRLTPTLG
jgi:RNA polymerase sigma-70 factor (ECF subfamily)